MADMMRAIGICLGASNLSMVEIQRNGHGIRVERVHVEPHGGNPRELLVRKIGDLEPARFDGVAVTGRKFRRLVNLPSITEPEAVEPAVEFVRSRNGRTAYSAVVSAGGETFMVYALDHNSRITTVHTGNKCASGTGEFFLQQIQRMDLDVEDAVDLACGSDPLAVSARCSVFCKSDCTHALNHGEPKGRIAAGLCEMMAKKISALLTRVNGERVLVVGGASRNEALMGFLKAEVPGVTVPEGATYFEALGAAIWALDHPSPGALANEIFSEAESTSFRFHGPLKEFENLVTFKKGGLGRAVAGDRCVIGLDVGSTTTKAALLRMSDDAVLARTYQRTSGDPVAAARGCYAALHEQTSVPVEIIGLGVTGSGRHIAGLHGKATSVVNEIIAHATAAVHHDPEVDTIFEIGGQDAKYTYITGGVPSDYAMNEACSAGTGSFLEESARETLGIEMEDIAEIAMTSRRAPDFNDQCAAFISSDIKNAVHEGIARSDIVAGLVYSVCLNYVNRVKGSRPHGKKIFMQGGVCYNRAVPIAMAGLVGKEIIVPPDPGMLGAFGVALEVKQRLNLGFVAPGLFDLENLSGRKVEYGKCFICRGGAENCDRHCEIQVLEIENQRFPFGGACDRYYNQRKKVRHDVLALDLVALRRKIVFENHVQERSLPEDAPRIGLQRSFLVNTLYPLYHTFFTELGMRVVLPEAVSEAGKALQGASFCHPVEIAHGLFDDLLKGPLDAIFLPMVTEMHVESGPRHKHLCPIVQAEPFYLRTAFSLGSGSAGDAPRILSPTLNFSGGFESQREVFLDIAQELGASKQSAAAAFTNAVVQQRACLAEMQSVGARVLEDLSRNPERFAVVLFGRPYNAFATEANMGIPHKFATRGTQVIPHDFLPIEDEVCADSMYWAMGQKILRAARHVEQHPQLFGTYITNFSCGPDSFLLTYFRRIMGSKPSLTLELDSHTADAGLNTRIDAALDIIRRYRAVKTDRETSRNGEIGHIAAEVVLTGKRSVVHTASGERVDLRDPRVHLIVPSMGDLGSEGLAAGFRSAGLQCSALPPADSADLRRGHGCTSCKECLPLALTSGSLLRYLEGGRPEGEITVFFMPTGTGPCRFGQYDVFMRNLVADRQLVDVAILSLSDDDAYSALGGDVEKAGWIGMLVSDVMDDIRNAILALARNREAGLARFQSQWQKILRSLESDTDRKFHEVLRRVAADLRTIPLKMPLEEAGSVAIVGEIFVRRDVLSKQDLVRRLADHELVVRVAQSCEYLDYSDHVLRHRLSRERLGFRGRLGLHVRILYKRRVERTIKKILATSGLYRFEMLDIDRTMAAGGRHIDERLLGEAVITTGAALREIVDTACGVISIGPFGCMPSRIAESILGTEMTVTGAKQANPALAPVLDNLDGEQLPFLAIETDGKVFPQVIDARLDAFILRAQRLHNELRERASVVVGSGAGPV